MLLRTALLALSERRAVGEAMDRLGLTRRLVRRFVAGTTAGDALAVIARLNGEGLAGAVTYLGEHVASEPAALAATQEYVRLLDTIHARNLDAVPSLKLTQLGLDLSPEICRANLARVAERGTAVGRRVWIDMEGSAYTDRTLDLYAELRPRFPLLACVVQSALRRTPRDLERLIELGATVRLCKGAYREPPSVAYPDKADVDRAYGRLATRLLAARAEGRHVYPAFATHDERMQALARTRAEARGVGPSGYEIQMLLGIRTDLHARLRSDGLTVRVLVPYGEEWYGYFMRRLAERPANLVFLARNLARY
ncbi:MAG TPA: proline dehydrogenase family protein [Methylomirabilota bacterium]|nr:proline dehydrogenase family protein [Methylomirabilota bacterium]